jgi:hypothetical protein
VVCRQKVGMVEIIVDFLGLRSATYTKDRPALSSEWVRTRKQDRNSQTVIKIWSQAPHGCFMPRQTGRLTFGRKLHSEEFSFVFDLRRLVSLQFGFDYSRSSNCDTEVVNDLLGSVQETVQ